MRFLIISHAEHKVNEERLYSYAPYVREMNLWLKYVDKVTVVAPFSKASKSSIDLAYNHTNIEHKIIPSIQFTTVFYAFTSFFKLPYILLVIFIECIKTDHIHLRCPGNIGMLGCFVQMLFPKKIKTAKYAGNWDPKAKQPISYNVQKWILKHTFLSKKMSVLVYGNWPKQTKNIIPFFTATYKTSERVAYKKRDFSRALNFIFVGSLSPGKHPLFAVKLIEALHKRAYNVTLNVFGEGIEQDKLELYVKTNNLGNQVKFHGNQPKEIIANAFKTSHFSILPSKSEGWPKAIAEAMFFGVVPIATRISCVPFMLDYGNRGILIDTNLSKAVEAIARELSSRKELENKSRLALDWSQKFTLDRFESEVAKLLKEKNK